MNYRFLIIIAEVVVLVFLIFLIIGKIQESRYPEDTSVATIDESVNVICSNADVNNDNKFTLGDFAAFAKKYNKVCSERITEDSLVGQTRVLQIRVNKQTPNDNALQLDLNFDGAVIQTVEWGYDGSEYSTIGNCSDSEEDPGYTESRICVAIAKTNTFLDEEPIATVEFEITSAEGVTISKTNENVYSDGENINIDEGLLFELQSTYINNECGNQDVNADNQINLTDFASFALRYGKNSCNLN